MTNRSVLFNLPSILNESAHDSINNDLILMEAPIINSVFYDPIKLDVSVAILCTHGTIKGRINLREYEIKAPSLFIIVAGQILQYQDISPDFKGYFIVMSTRFTDSLFSNLQERYPLRHSVSENPLVPLSETELQLMVDYYHLLRNAVRMKDNPYRTEVVQHLTKAFFFTTGYQYHKTQNDVKKSKFDILYHNFQNLVQQHFKQKRDVEFYASELCITPKYLSKILKEKTDKTASEWISEHVILEAKALLKSTNLTIQQISDVLNFPSQSFFGKYFKQYVGVSPKEYRMNTLTKQSEQYIR